MKNRAGSRWRTPVEFPTSYVRDSQLATLEHFAQLGLPPIGIDIDVVRKFWVDHPEHRDYAARTAQPQN